MGTLKIGSSSNKAGVTVEPIIVLFNGNKVSKIMKDTTTVWKEKTFLYLNGDKCTDVTNGWSVIYSGGGTATFNSDHIYINATVTDFIRIQTNNKFDLSKYSKLCMECTVFNVLGDYKDLAIKPATAIGKSVNTVGLHLVEVDLTNINITDNIMVQAVGTLSAKVNKVWLEQTNL